MEPGFVPWRARRKPKTRGPVGVSSTTVGLLSLAGLVQMCTVAVYTTSVDLLYEPLAA